MVFMILYVWSKKDPYRTVTFWGFDFQAWHFPFVLALFSLLVGNSPLLDCVGIAVGHVYYFLMDVVPRVYGKVFLRTPEFLYRLFDQANVVGRSQGWQRSGGHRLGAN